MKNKKIAVLHAQVPFKSGGAELMVSSLVNNIRKRGYDAELISIPYKWYPENTLYDSMISWRMLDLSESDGEKIDLVIPTKFPTYGIEHHNKVSWIMHQFRQVYDLYNNKYGLSQWENGVDIREKVINFDNKVINESKEVYTIAKNVSNRLRKYNGIDSKHLYHPPSLEGRYINGDYNDYILSVGRVDPLKRNNILIKSLKFCDKRIKAKIAGKGPQIEELKKLAKSIGVDERVEFLGYVSDDDLISLYSNSFAVFFSPLDEDYGYVTLEAFLSKKPVITCVDSGGVLEFVSDGNSGFVCDVEVENIAQKINLLFMNKDMCNDMGNYGYETVKDISWDNVIDKLTSTLR